MTKIKEIKLKHCPFCGGEATVQRSENMPYLYYPRCATGNPNGNGAPTNEVCIGNQGWVSFTSEEDAIKYWNKRVRYKLVPIVDMIK